MSENNEFVVAEEVAIPELKAFAEYHLDEKVTDEDIEKKYPAVLKALMRGKLDISDTDAPVLTLIDPIRNEAGEIDTTVIKFKTRIKPSAQQALMKGIDIQKDLGKYLSLQTTHLCNFDSVNYLDKLSKRDYKVIDQISNLFT